MRSLKLHFLVTFFLAATFLAGCQKNKMNQHQTTPVAQAAANASIAKLMRDRTRLEGEIAQLIARKSGMPEADYEKELERLFIELAKVNRAIRQGSNASE